MPETDGVCALLLAAGSSQRFGSDKRLYMPPGFNVNLIQRTAICYAAQFDEMLIALRPEDRNIRTLLKSMSLSADLEFVEVEDASSGMGHSIAAAARELLLRKQPPDILFIALADMPYIQPETLNTLHHQALSCGADSIIQPRFQRQPGHPVGFGRNLFNALAQLSGDSGARAVLDNHRQTIHFVEVEDSGILKDIDRPIVAEPSE